MIDWCLQQRSFYPLFPAAEGTQISLGHANQFELQTTPDILILPSQLNPFAKRVSDVLCINPGRLTKGSTAGTFCQVTMHPVIRNIPCATERVNSKADASVTDCKDGVSSLKPLRLSADFDAVNVNMESIASTEQGNVETVASTEGKNVSDSENQGQTSGQVQSSTQSQVSVLMCTKPDEDTEIRMDNQDAYHAEDGQARESHSHMQGFSATDVHAKTEHTQLHSSLPLNSEKKTHRVLERSRVDIIRI